MVAEKTQVTVPDVNLGGWSVRGTTIYWECAPKAVNFKCQVCRMIPPSVEGEPWTPRRLHVGFFTKDTPCINARDHRLVNGLDGNNLGVNGISPDSVHMLYVQAMIDADGELVASRQFGVTFRLTGAETFALDQYIGPDDTMIKVEPKDPPPLEAPRPEAPAPVAKPAAAPAPASQPAQAKAAPTAQPSAASAPAASTSQPHSNIAARAAGTTAKATPSQPARTNGGRDGSAKTDEQIRLESVETSQKFLAEENQRRKGEAERLREVDGRTANLLNSTVTLLKELSERRTALGMDKPAQETATDKTSSSTQTPPPGGGEKPAKKETPPDTGGEKPPRTPSRETGGSSSGWPHRLKWIGALAALLLLLALALWKFSTPKSAGMAGAGQPTNGIVTLATTNGPLVIGKDGTVVTASASNGPAIRIDHNTIQSGATVLANGVINIDQRTCGPREAVPPPPRAPVPQPAPEAAPKPVPGLLKRNAADAQASAGPTYTWTHMVSMNSPYPPPDPGPAEQPAPQQVVVRESVQNVWSTPGLPGCYGGSAGSGFCLNVGTCFPGGFGCRPACPAPVYRSAFVPTGRPGFVATGARPFQGSHFATTGPRRH